MKRIISITLVAILTLSIAVNSYAMQNNVKTENITIYDSMNNKITISVSNDTVTVNEYINGQKTETAVANALTGKVVSFGINSPKRTIDINQIIEKKLTTKKSLIGFRVVEPDEPGSISITQKSPINSYLGKYYLRDNKTMTVNYSEKRDGISEYTIKRGTWKVAEVVATIALYLAMPASFIEKHVIKGLLITLGFGKLVGKTISVLAEFDVSCYVFKYTFHAEDTKTSKEGFAKGKRYVVESTKHPDYNGKVYFDTDFRYDEAVERTEYFHKIMSNEVYGIPYYPR